MANLRYIEGRATIADMRSGRRRVQLDDAQQRALDRLKEATAAWETNENAARDAIVEAGRARVPQARVITASEYTRSHVHGVWRDAGIPPLPQGTGHLQMTPEQEKALAKVRQTAEARLDSQRACADALLDAGRAGVPQALVADASGYSRERVRQLWRAAGIG